MKRRNFISVAGGSLVLAACGNNPLNKSTNPEDAVTAEQMGALIESGHIAKDSLQFMREEEKLARDVYITLFAKWGLPIFDNIAASEQVHTDRIKSLLDKYNIEDPAASTDIGEFVNPKIQGYYTTLIQRGNISSLEALHVAGYIEELDIGDLRHEISNSTSNDVINVYTNLMNGSYNHLKAFVGQIEKNGITYKAQLLEQSDVDSIVASGGSNGNGGGGNGNGGGGGGNRN